MRSLSVSRGGLRIDSRVVCVARCVFGGLALGLRGGSVPFGLRGKADRLIRGAIRLRCMARSKARRALRICHRMIGLAGRPLRVCRVRLRFGSRLSRGGGAILCLERGAFRVPGFLLRAGRRLLGISRVRARGLRGGIS